MSSGTKTESEGRGHVNEYYSHSLSFNSPDEGKPENRGVLRQGPSASIRHIYQGRAFSEGS